MHLKVFKIVSIIFCLLSIGLINAQSDGIVHYYETKIGQASDNTFTQSEPAQLIATFQNNDTISDSYLINGYIDAGWVKEREGYYQKVSLAYEVQKNKFQKNRMCVNSELFILVPSVI